MRFGVTFSTGAELFELEQLVKSNVQIAIIGIIFFILFLSVSKETDLSAS